MENLTQGLPPWAKGAIVVGGVALGFYVIKQVVQAPRNLKEGFGFRDESKESYQEMDKLENAGGKATLTDSQASQIANQIHTALDGYGTDETSIVNAMKKIKNNLDFLKVKNKYDVRVVSSGRFNPEPNYKGNLPGALHSDMSTYWTDLINKNLKANGVTYTV